MLVKYVKILRKLMKVLLRYKLLLLILLILSACVGDKQLAEATYFGGKIINPKDSQVFFYKNNQLLDSVTISDKNKFSFKFDSINEGLYTFMHGPEVQFIFLEPSDSLLLRLNTWDFDESLVYSGKGADKNNLLINLFLANEKEDKLFYKYYTLKDSIFEHKIDSLLKVKRLLLSTFRNDQLEVSPLFEKYVKAIIELPLYTKKEAYPYRHEKALKLDAHPHVHPKFYKFRKTIDLQDNDLQNLYVFHDYMKTYLYHLSYEKQVLSDHEEPMAVNFLQAVADHVSDENLKNQLLDEGIWNVTLSQYLTDSQSNKAYNIFFEHCTNSKLSKNIELMVKAKEHLPKNTQLPELVVLNSFENKVRINDVIKNAPSVIYFWPKNNRQMDNMAKRVKYLENRYPDVQFIGVNASQTSKDWKHYIKSYQLKDKTQFNINENLPNDWLFVNHSRAIVIDKKGEVTNNFTHLSSRNIEYQLQKLANK